MAKLIAAYGEWWDPHAVEWGSQGAGNQGRLEGIEKGSRGLTIDIWDQRGIYVLFQDWSVMYVGKTGNQPLGRRLKQHRADDVAGRWDRFSWFGVRNINADGSLGATPLPSRQVRAPDVIATLEAVLIRVTTPSLNHRRESIPEAKLLVQPAPPARPLRAYLAGIEQELEQIRTLVTQAGTPST
ncbi:MAG: GIY-YIG nuclease family protein [Solirubrobacteraceae bacterium]